MRLPILIMTPLLLLSCSKNGFPDYGQLGSLRVLTIKALADQGEVNPGTTVTLQPVISDLSGGGRTLTVNVQTCADPGIAFGAQPQCVQPDSNTTSSFSSTTLGSGSTYIGLAPTFTASVPAAPVNYTLASMADQYNGVAYLVIYTLSAADGSSTTAFKRIIVSSPSKATKNRNPAISSVTDNGAALVASNAYSGALATLVPSFSVGPESYQVMNADGSLTSETETLTSTWYYTDGSMEYQRTTDTDSNQWTPAGPPPTRSAALVVITNDGRGGEDYQIFVFN